MAKSKSTKTSANKAKASQKPQERKLHGQPKRGFHTQKRRGSDGSNTERSEVEPKESRPRKKVRRAEVDVDNEDNDEEVEVEEVEEDIEEVDGGNGGNADTDSNQQVSMVCRLFQNNTLTHDIFAE
jgi:hypothetical protein